MKRKARLNPLCAVVVFGAITLLSACTGASDPIETSPSPTSAATPAPVEETPVAETPETPIGVIPSDCRDLLDAETAASFFGDTPLNDPSYGVPESGAVEPTAPPADAEPLRVLIANAELWCVWSEPRAEQTGLTARIARVDLAVAEPYFAQDLPAEGFSCTEEYEGRLCQLVQENDLYPVEEGRTYLLRDDIFISVVQSNFPTDGLMDELVATIWS